MTDIDAMIGEIEKYAIDEDRAYTNSRYNNYAIVILCSELRRAREALEKAREETGLDDPGFGGFTPLQFAARLGLIDGICRAALAERK